MTTEIMIQQLNPLLQQEVIFRKQKVDEIVDSYNAGNISVIERDDLLQTALDFDTIVSLCTSAEEEIELKHLIEQIINIVTSIPIP